MHQVQTDNFYENEGNSHFEDSFLFSNSTNIINVFFFF